MASSNRGSIWGKWDLHVHTPLSIVNEYPGDQDAAWASFIEKLKNLPPEIKAIAVCDYLFIDGYEKLLEYRDELSNLELILPSIEFRLDTFAGTEHNTKRHNYHVIFSDEVKPDIIREQFLNGIQGGYQLSNKDAWNQNPTPRSLEEFGKLMKANAPADNTIQSKSNLEAGFDNITYNRKDLEKLLERDVFKNRHLTAIGYTEWSQGKWDQSAAAKRDLISSSKFCLTNNDDEEVIQEHVQDLIKNKLNPRVLHSSDAHKLERLDGTKLWVKADTTFNGLRVALREYGDRIFIGTTPPDIKQDSEVIDKVTIKNSHGWFKEDLEVELNPDMVAVIGGRGSGKSALVEMIAYATGAYINGDDTFISKAKKHRTRSIAGTEIEVKWRDGSISKGVIDGKVDLSQRVQYLPQKYVEKIVDPEDSKELTGQIERVVFDALGDAARQGASSFGELQTQVVSPVTHSKESIVTDLFSKNQSINTMRKDITAIPQKQEEVKKTQEAIEAMTKSLPKLSKEDEEVHKKLEKLETERFSIEQKIAEIKSTLNSVEELDTRSIDYLEKISQIEQWLTNSLIKLGIDETIVAQLKFNFDKELLQKTVEKLRKDFTQNIETLKKGKKADVASLLGKVEKDLQFANHEAYAAEIDTQQKKLKAHQTSRARYAAIKERIQQLTRKNEALAKEIDGLLKVTKPELEKALEDRKNMYASYFELVVKEKQLTEGLYQPLEEALAQDDGETSSESRLKFTAKVIYELKEQLDAGLNIIDRTKKGPFRDRNLLQKALSDFYDDILGNEFDPIQVKRAITELEEKFKTDDEGDSVDIDKQLRSSFDTGDFDNWLYNPNFYHIKSSIQFDGIDINLLSPGQRGIVLLLLFLSIDSEDRRPLLIDQPEDNLDNLSVYRELIESFRRRKKGRQIIIITHNPNLVVNTDSEQIIVAKFKGEDNPCISYKAGSLENKANSKANSDDEVENGIIEEVCDILEGGGIALNQRQGKYHLSEVILSADKE